MGLGHLVYTVETQTENSNALRTLFVCRYFLWFLLHFTIQIFFLALSRDIKLYEEM